EELGLLPEAELADRAEGDGTLAEVARAGGVLELFVPLLPEGGELPLVPIVGERVGLRGGLRERHVVSASEWAGTPTYRADGLIRRPVLRCSTMWADQPATRAHAKRAGYIAGGTSAISRTTAAQNSTFVSSTRSGERSRSAVRAASSSCSAIGTRGEPSSRA